MAGSIIATLKLKTDEFQKELDEVKNKLEKTSSDFKKVGTALKSVGGTMLSGVKIAADFEKIMAKVGAASGASDSELKQLNETAKKLGASTSYTAIQVAEGMEYLAMSGLEASEIIVAMPEFLDMATVGHDSLSDTVTLLNSAWEGVKISIGEYFIPYVNEAAQWLKVLVDWFNGLSESQKDSIGKWLAISSAVFLVLGELMVIVGYLPNVIDGIQSVINVAKGLGSAFMFLTTNPMGLLIVAITALIAVFVYLWKTNEDFRNKVIEIWETIKTALIAVWDYLLPWLQDIWENIAALATFIFEGLQQFWDTWGDYIIALFTFMWDIVSAVFEAAFNIIMAIVKFALETIKNIFGFWVAIFTGDWEKAWGYIKAQFQAYWDLITGIFRGIWTLLTGLFNAFRDNFNNLWSSLWQGIYSMFANIITNTINRFKDLPRAIIGALTDMVNGIKNKVEQAKNLLSNLNPFKRHSPSLVDNILAGVDVIKDTYRSIGEMEINGPSIGGLIPGRINLHDALGSFDGSSAAALSGSNYNAPLVHVDKMEVRDDNDIRLISSELYNLQRSSERSRGR
ncbi:phage tail tape measure protein [Alkaliphilus peptidifermentans]|uniref:Phage tail tape measure protein, TP901 family, core region n=1 Tax=Alkaliphilus peptidifermentans DSM 18978 TaxID=1120976 RepID=A0A1G5JLC7_9FIRM|nr:phage tail tape measure protein [Alkaliphilus peptidifermentans]SCY88539.1 phage tail tape measure protein, TP901 family, core region [Alkaliphilus peptidifermentans DSM 18978]